METHFKPAEPKPFGIIQDPPGLPLALGPRRRLGVDPDSPAIAKRLRVARLQRRIGWFSIAISVASALYFVAQLLRAVLS